MIVWRRYDRRQRLGQRFQERAGHARPVLLKAATRWVGGLERANGGGGEATASRRHTQPPAVQGPTQRGTLGLMPPPPLEQVTRILVTLRPDVILIDSRYLVYILV